MTSTKTIAVFGATGAQGGGVVAALKNRGGFVVRAPTRNHATHEGPADEVIAADFTYRQTNSDMRGVGDHESNQT